MWSESLELNVQRSHVHRQSVRTISTVGGSLRDVQMLAGHRGLSTTQRVHRSGCGSTEARRGACIKRHSNRSFGPHRTARPVNAAIIAGNPPDTRIDRLREFWTQVTADSPWSSAGNACVGLARGDAMRQLLNQMSAGFAMASGVRGSSRHARCRRCFSPPAR